MKRLTEQLFEAGRWVAEALSRLSFRGDRAPIDSVDRVFEFVSTRAALVTQKKLYGYLKERIGLRYPAMFEDDAFAQSIDIAKMQVFAASLSDLTVYAVALVSAGGGLEQNGTRRALALACYRAGIADNADKVVDVRSPTTWVADFERRLDETLWGNIASGANPFVESPKALIKWAPIADEHKKYDREIVENSMRFAWNETRQDFRTRLDARAVVADWTARDAG